MASGYLACMGGMGVVLIHRDRELLEEDGVCGFGLVEFARPLRHLLIGAHCFHLVLMLWVPLETAVYFYYLHIPVGM